jgi:hypothetical protein
MTAAMVLTNLSVNFVSTGCILLSVVVIIVAIRWWRDINNIKMKNDKPTEKN